MRVEGIGQPDPNADVRLVLAILNLSSTPSNRVHRRRLNLSMVMNCNDEPIPKVSLITNNKYILVTSSHGGDKLVFTLL